MRTVDDYLNLVTSEHRDQPSFIRYLTAILQPALEAQAFIADMPRHFDLDEAIGVQLDVLGEWIGRSRFIDFPIPTSYFSFGDTARGFGRGIWKFGEGETEFGISRLEDETYRRLLRAKIRANHWDGTLPDLVDALTTYFDSTGSLIFAVDHQDMTMTVYAAGRLPNLVDLSILDAGYIPLKPGAVRVNYRVVSVSGTPLFGFGVDNNYVGGFGHGSWAVEPSYVLDHTVPELETFLPYDNLLLAVF
jgi:hypothetical protein